MTAETETTAPPVAIRARPPSPRRLSRKVLMAGVAVLAALAVTALVLGLGKSRESSHAANHETAATSGPPDTIGMAASQYDPASLSGGQTLEPLPPELDLAEPAPIAPTPTGAAPPDPEATARTAPIMFSAGAANGGPGAVAAGADGEERLEARLSPPRSPYEILAGSVIPAALLTELNSDLPGRVIAQVTAPVFDSVSGAHLLIPQGARLIGTYDDATAYGDRRILLVWNRLIFPDGWSINLEDMQGADPAGAAGVRDRIDNHTGRIAIAATLSAIIGVAANEAEDGEDDNNSFGASVGDAAAQEAARTGGRLVERELQVRPTLRVRPGAPVRVLVMRDIRLRPYRR